MRYNMRIVCMYVCNICMYAFVCVHTCIYVYVQIHTHQQRVTTDTHTTHTYITRARHIRVQLVDAKINILRCESLRIQSILPLPVGYEVGVVDEHLSASGNTNHGAPLCRHVATSHAYQHLRIAEAAVGIHELDLLRDADCVSRLALRRYEQEQ